MLITGHTGFKGTWLTLLLEHLKVEVAGYSHPAVRGSLFERLNRESRIKEQNGDIRDTEKFNKFLNNLKPQVIFHLAAQPLVMESYRNPLETFDVNVMGTAKIIESASKTDFVKLIVVVTSDKVYKNSNLGIRFKENDPLMGYDPYSASKVGTEAVASAWRRIVDLNELGPKIVTVRSGNVIGGGDNTPGRLLPDIVEGFINNLNVNIKNPKSTRPWQHVLDPLFGYILAADYVLGGGEEESFNFGPNSKSLSVEEVLTIAKDSWTSRTKINILPDHQNLESKFLDLDSNLAITRLNWSPVWSQEDAIRSTLKWWENVEVNKISEIEACGMDIERLTSAN